MASSKGTNVSTPGTYPALAVPSVARRVQYVNLEPAVHQVIWHAKETVRMLSRFIAFLFAHTQVVLQAAQVPKEIAVRALGAAQLVRWARALY
jgi:hypothetical protein